jgi:hypothetical protein
MTRQIPKAALLTAAAILAAAGAWATATAQDKAFVGATDASRKQCFILDRVEGYVPIKLKNGIDGMNLRDGKNFYQMIFTSPCPSLTDALKISITSKNASRYICSPSDADVVSYSQLTRPEHCDVSGLRKIEPDELASMPKSERP